MTNTTDYNIEFHADYKSGLEEGLRCPIDDGGGRSNRDRPLALGSHDPAWEKGSINRAVKHIADYFGYTIKPEDLTNYNSGKMTIDQARNYLNKRMLYGFNGESRNTVPKDMMAFRGYPTYEIESVEYLHMELNQSTVLTNTHGGQISVTSSDFVGQQLTSSLPISAGNDYLIWEGRVTLKEEFPFDKVYINLAQETYIENSLATFDPMFTGVYYDRDFGAKTECINSGDNKTFYFRMASEISNSDIPSDQVYLKFDNDMIQPFGDDAWYGMPIIQKSLFTLMDITWDGLKWVGDADFIYDTEAPTTPQNLSISEEYGLMTMTCDAAFDNIKVKGYRFYVKEGNRRTWTEYDSVGTTEIVSVSGDTYYEVYVTAFDESGNESLPSDIQSITTSVSTLLQIAYLGDVSYDTSGEACSLSILADPVYCENPEGIVAGTHQGILYQDSNGTIPFVGGYKWWRFGKWQGDLTTCTIFVRDTGDIVGYNPCTSQ